MTDTPTGHVHTWTPNPVPPGHVQTSGCRCGMTRLDDDIVGFERRALQVTEARAALRKYRTQEALDVAGAWLVEAQDGCTCGAGPLLGLAHEPGCGYLPITTHPVLRIAADPAVLDVLDELLADAEKQLVGVWKLTSTDEPGATALAMDAAAAIMAAVREVQS